MEKADEGYEMKTSELKQQWALANEGLKAARSEFRATEKAIMCSPIPKRRRPAEPGDITEGAFIWYPEHPRGRQLKIVDQVKYPEDDFKAFCATDGCRYGLLGAFVEMEERG